MALYFGNSTGDLIDIGSSSSLDNLVSPLVLAWVRMPNLGRGQYLFSKCNNSNQNIVAFYNGGTLVGNRRAYATTNEIAEADKSNFAAWGYDKWLCFAASIAGDGTTNPRLWMGDMATLMAEPSAYSTQTPKVGAQTTDASPSALIGNKGVTSGSKTLSLGGDIAYLAYFDAIPTLAELIAWQFNPGMMLGANRAKAFYALGWHGTTVPDLSGSGNAGTVTGATVAFSEPLGLLRRRGAVLGSYGTTGGPQTVTATPAVIRYSGVTAAVTKGAVSPSPAAAVVRYLGVTASLTPTRTNTATPAVVRYLGVTATRSIAARTNTATPAVVRYLGVTGTLTKTRTQTGTAAVVRYIGPAPSLTIASRMQTASPAIVRWLGVTGAASTGGSGPQTVTGSAAVIRYLGPAPALTVAARTVTGTAAVVRYVGPTASRSVTARTQTATPAAVRYLGVTPTVTAAARTQTATPAVVRYLGVTASRTSTVVKTATPAVIRYLGPAPTVLPAGRTVTATPGVVRYLGVTATVYAPGIAVLVTTTVFQLVGPFATTLAAVAVAQWGFTAVSPMAVTARPAMRP